MSPTINQGDLVIYKPYNQVKSDLYIGNIVVAKHPIELNKLIIKRISKIEINGVQLIGDNQTSSNDSRHFGLINYEKLIGIVERIIPKSS